MSGPIIINHSKVLLDAATDPSVYHGMTPNQKDAVDIIQAKAPADRTQADVNQLLVILAGVCGC